jgi:type IV secretory pathway VirB10-like protein
MKEISMRNSTLMWLASAIVVSTVAAPDALARGRKKPKPTPPAKPPVAAPASNDTPVAAPAATPSAPTPVPAAVDAAKPDPSASPPPTPPTLTPPSPPPEQQPSSEVATVDQLRQEYLSLRDELFASRARAAAVSSQLFSTQIVIRFRFDAGRYYSVPKASIRLDGASIFDDSQGAIAGDDAVRFTGYVAPGHHVISFRVETVGKDDRFSSATEAQVSVEAVAGKDLMIAAKAKDSGDIPYAWKRSERGDYGLSMSVSVKTEKPATAAKETRATK